MKIFFAIILVIPSVLLAEIPRELPAKRANTILAAPLAMPNEPVQVPLKPPVIQQSIQPTQALQVEARIIQPAPEADVAEPSINYSKPQTSVVNISAPPEPPSSTLVFIRGGYLQANYSKFDSRMNNGASSVGLGAAHAFNTQWGIFEARGAFDLYHALDQSVSIDNARMFSTRTEVAYWLSHARVKPGISLGLGWSEYSIRSYRSVNGGDTVVRNHASSQAFSIIPATALRFELGSSVTSRLVLDLQTEYIALLGGADSDAAQGLAGTVGLGWIF